MNWTGRESVWGGIPPPRSKCSVVDTANVPQNHRGRGRPFGSQSWGDTRLRDTPKESITLLKFMYGQLYNDKLAKRYGHVPTDDCPICHHPNSCTHIAGELVAHKNLSISRHNAACQLIHAAIRNSAKGGGALYRAQDLLLVAVDTRKTNQTTEEEPASLVTPHKKRET